MGALRRDGGTARQHAGNDHQADRAASLGVRGERRGAARVLGARSDDDRHAGRDQLLDARHPLFVVEQRPVAHRAAVDDAPTCRARRAPCPFAPARRSPACARGVQGVMSAGITPVKGFFVMLGLSRWATYASRYALMMRAGGASRLGGKASRALRIPHNSRGAAASSSSRRSGGRSLATSFSTRFPTRSSSSRTPPAAMSRPTRCWPSARVSRAQGGVDRPDRRRGVHGRARPPHRRAGSRDPEKRPLAQGRARAASLSRTARRAGA